MSKTRSLLLAAILAATGYASTCQASIVFTLTQATGGLVNMNIAATGTVDATNDIWLLVGSATSDTFLPSGSPAHSGAGPVPGLAFGGCTASNNFYRDDNGFNGVQSLLGFYFGAGGCQLNGLLNLADLNGDYVLPGSSYAAFVAGTYTSLISGTNNLTLQGLGDITLVVGTQTRVPEPATLALAALGLLCAGYGSRRRAH